MAIPFDNPLAVGGGSSAPSGPAGGDLAGTYPNPTLAASIATNVQFTGQVGINVTHVSKTADYAVLAADQDVVFDNSGASGTVVFTLPTPVAGMRFSFLSRAARAITIATASTAQTIRLAQLSSDATTNSITSELGFTNEGIGVFVTLEAVSTTTWYATSVVGNWLFGTGNTAAGNGRASGGDTNVKSFSTKTADYTALLTDTGRIFSNSGAAGTVVLTLPPTTISFAGMNFSFAVLTAQTLEVLAPATVTIQLGASLSSTGGNIQSSTVGSVVSLVNATGLRWIATSVVGNWTVA